MRKHRTLIPPALILSSCMLFSGCGALEKTYDEANYESLTNERGNVEVFSGGMKVREFNGAKIIYSDSDSMALWLDTEDGRFYVQGDVVIHLR